MKPKFKNPEAYEQAQLLMQPIFIRVLDNIRKQLENSPWHGTYQEVQEPFPGYHLCLTHQAHSVTVDLWHLCFQICFLDYPSLQEGEVVSERDSTTLINRRTAETLTPQEVDIDTSLIDETGDVDWHRLENKTQELVEHIFANLPQD